MGASATCELIREGFLGQPVNAVTALAISLGGLLVAARGKVRHVGLAMVVTGIGSFLSHGPMPPWADRAHQVTLAALILVIAGVGTRWERWAWPAGIVGFGVTFVASPVLEKPVVVAVTVAAIVSVLIKDRSIHTLAPLGLLAVAAAIGRLGDTGGPLCDPTSFWQPHALWHIGAAAAVTWWALAYARTPAPVLSG